jgi:hypothetical protein
VPEYAEVTTVISVQAVLRAKPHKAFGILQDTIYRVLGKSFIHLYLPEMEIRMINGKQLYGARKQQRE